LDLTALAIDRNRVTLTIVALVILAGVFAFQSLPKAQDPGFVVRTAVITTRFPGASPERVELLVTDKIERKIQEMPEIDSITSESRTGISVIYANFKESYKIMRPIFDDLRRKVDSVTPDLPQGAALPEVNDEFGDVFGSVYTLSGDGFSYAELKTVADKLRDELLKEPDIAKVTIHGEQQEVIFVEYNNARLAELGLSPQQLSAALTSVNILSSGGDIVSGRERITLEPTGNFESVEDLQRTVIELPGRALVYLEDIVEIDRAYKDPPDSISRVNGEPTLAIAISMRDGGDILKLGERLDELMPELVSRYPWGIEIEKVWFQADLVDNVVTAFSSSLIQAIVIVILVMIAFLGLRTGLVVGSLIPTSIVASFFAMELFDITINQISLTALIIALGLLVDNAIVIVESILVRREKGMDAVTAAIESGKELKTPLLISSLTTAAAFMPIAMAKSAVGEYTSDIFYVVGIALLSSWLLAMTFVPMLTTVALDVKKTNGDGDDPFAGRWYAFYRNLLTLSLRCQYRFFAVIVLIFVVAIVGMGFVRQEFIAPSEDPVFSAKLELPLGTSIETSQAVIADIDQFIERTYYAPTEGTAKVRNWLTFIGEGGPRFQQPEPAEPESGQLLCDCEHAGRKRRRRGYCRYRGLRTPATSRSRCAGEAPRERPTRRLPDYRAHFRQRHQYTLQRRGPGYGIPVRSGRGLKHQEFLGSADQETGRRCRPGAGAALRRHERGRGLFVAGRPDRYRSDAVPRRRRADPGHAANDCRRPAGLQQARRPDRLFAKHRRQCAAETGRQCRPDL